MTFDPAVLAQYGLLGIILGWFMFVFSKKMDTHSAVISDLSKTILLDILSREAISESVRVQAQALMDRVASRPHFSVLSRARTTPTTE